MHPILLARSADRLSVNGDGDAVAAHMLSWQRRDRLDQRHAQWQITTRRKEHGDIVRRRHDGEVADAQITGRTDGVEADRHAGSGVPDQLRWRIDSTPYRDDIEGWAHHHHTGKDIRR